MSDKEILTILFGIKTGIIDWRWLHKNLSVGFQQYVELEKLAMKLECPYSR